MASVVEEEIKVGGRPVWERQQKDEDSISNRPNDRNNSLFIRNPAELTTFLVGCHNGEASEAVLMAGKEWTYYTGNYEF